MQDSATSALLSRDAAAAAMGVRYVRSDHGSVSFAQNTIPSLADDVGRFGLPMFGVLLDCTVGSAGYCASETQPIAVVASMSIALTGATSHSAELVADGWPVHVDDTTGTALGRAEVRTGDGVVLATATARAAKVERSMIDGIPALSPADLPLGPTSTTDSGGPADVYGLTVVDRSAGTTTASVEPKSWMLNPFGSVQGGVLVGLMATATEVAARPLAERGQGFYLADIGVDLIRSPALSMGELIIETTLVRRGRRFCLLDSELRTADGKTLVRSHGTILLT